MSQEWIKSWEAYFERILEYQIVQLETIEPITRQNILLEATGSFKRQDTPDGETLEKFETNSEQSPYHQIRSNENQIGI